MRLLGLLPLLALGACASPRMDAARDVHALLAAVRDNDRATFEQHVDREALKQSLESGLRDTVDSAPLPERLRDGGQNIAGLVARLGSEALVQPLTFRLAAAALGYRPDQPLPPPAVIAGSLRQTGPGRVCAARRSDAPCLMTFERQGGTWRFVAFDGALGDLAR